ncbi:hypothetical protein DE146DRAFT_637724 [Phaeosphaeria sp. MPI-PUGE-AT-0046c]|nr:hypothetical protein DE146DRAFT_637724 [Phaeosphaeria sp. MPI-PUGE-AT-0046c]
MLFTPPSDMSPLVPNRDMWVASPYQATTQEDAAEWYAILADESSQAAADTPYSFHNRARRTTLPRTQSSNNAMPEDARIDDLSNSYRADSGIGNFDDLPAFDNHVHDPPLAFGHQDEYHWHAENGLFPADDTKENDEENPHTCSLQYHLIKTTSRTNVRNVPSDETKKAEVCPLCPNKQYTGVWAHRNLTRHIDCLTMSVNCAVANSTTSFAISPPTSGVLLTAGPNFRESVHAPCASSDGLRQIRCGYHNCDRTFRREDARLVHERKSHPELNRPPAAKRKRSDDL